MSQELRDAGFIAQDNRANFKNVIAKRSDLARFDSGRMVAPASGIVKYNAGQVLGKVTASGKYKAYDATASDGSEVAVGILAEEVMVDSTGFGSKCLIIKSGVLFKDMLIGLDAAAITALKGSVSQEDGVNLIAIYA